MRCKATVAVQWKGADVTLTIEGDELDETLRQAAVAVRKLRQRGAERPQRYVLALGKVTPERPAPAGRWSYPGGGGGE